MDNELIRAIGNKPLIQILLIVVFVPIGLFAFILPIRDYRPITREAAEVYSGTFDSYESDEYYKGINFTDGSYYSVYPHTVPEEFRDAMEKMESGTELSLAVNPKSGYVIEVICGNEEILNFEASQGKMYNYQKAYVWIGVFFCTAPIFIFVYFTAEKKSLKKESARQQKQKSKTAGIRGINTPELQSADGNKKGRIFLRAKVKSYEIVYRRVKFVNELVINGQVYDEKKAVVEFAHNLYAVIDDHTIEAGINSDDYSYIKFDGATVVQKRRLI